MVISKHSLYFRILLIGVLFESLNGVLRYYFDMVRIGLLIYFPKILMFILGFIFIFYFIFRGNFKKNLKILLLIFLLIWYSFYSLLNVPMLSFLFGIYMIGPLLFGIGFAKMTTNYSDLTKIFGMVFIISVLGVWIDFFYEVPWEGYYQKIGDFEIEASRSWSIFDIERPAGFARLSAAAAIIIGISSIFYIMSFKKSLLKFILFLLSFATIIITTSKSTAAAYVLVAPLMFNKKIRKYYAPLSILCSLLLGVSLPLSSITYGIELPINDSILLTSFQDRLINTWPNVYDILNRLIRDNFLLYLFGVGIGGFGSASRYFFATEMAVADNAWLYIYALSGFIGVFFMVYIALKSFKLIMLRNEHLVSLGIVLNLIFWIGISTDIYESLIPLFLLGYAYSLSVADFKNQKLNSENLLKERC